MLAEKIDSWNRKIWEEGFREGFQEGLEEVRREAVLRSLLHQKFGSLSPEAEERIRSAGRDQLLEWSKRVLTAERLQDVFGLSALLPADVPEFLDARILNEGL